MLRMKYFLAAILILACSFGQAQNAQSGYEIKVTLKPFKNQYIYLGHYSGKQLPIIDSVKINDKSEGVFKGSKKLGGGIYLIGFPNRSSNFEILIDKNQHFSVIADTASLPEVKFLNSPENVGFKAYQSFMNKNGMIMDQLYRQRTGVSASDSARLMNQIDSVNNLVKQYRSQIMKKDPDGLLTMYLNTMKEPEVPVNDPAAKTDSLFAWRYFKKHYWDLVNLTDDRLVRTPFFEPKVDKYFDQLVYPQPDSVIKEMDMMMSYASVSPEMEKFMLLKFINRYMNQKYMWEDAVFVHLFEKYFAQKNYSWLSEKGRKLITDRAYSLMANIFGNPAADVDLPDPAGKQTSLYSINAPYVLVAIWDPTCGHCKEVLPKLDSFYQAKWKGYGLKIFGLAKETDGTRQNWLDFIKQKELGSWIHVYYSKEEEKARTSAGIPGYSQLYDVQSFPTLYLLDKDKRIIAKKVTYEQVDEILEYKLKTN